MNIYKLACLLALCAGIGVVTTAPSQARGQDQRQQGNQQDQRGKGNQGRGQQGQQGQRQQGNRGQGQGQQQNRGQNQQGNRGRGHQQDRGQGGQQAQGRGQQGDRGRGAQGRANYQFRSQDADRLRQYYRGNLGRINRNRRAYFAPGGYIPAYYRGYFQPIPPDMMGYLQPTPPGYAMGYYNGYCVVYNPATYLIASVLNLLQ